MDPLLDRKWVGLAFGPLHQELGQFPKDRIVGQREGLKGRVGPTAAGAYGTEVGAVEGCKQGIGCTSKELGVHRFSVSICPRVLFPGLGRLGEVVHAGWLGWMDARSSDSQANRTACGKGSVAEDLCIEPNPRLPCEHPIGRIDLRKLLAPIARLLVGFRRDDSINQVLERPTRIDPVTGEPIELLRMAWHGPLQSKIVLGFDQSGPE